jgi:hypothetical protein
VLPVASAYECGATESYSKMTTEDNPRIMRATLMKSRQDGDGGLKILVLDWLESWENFITRTPYVDYFSI